MIRKRPGIKYLIVLSILLLSGYSRPAVALSITGLNEHAIIDGGSGAHELSGITYIGAVAGQPDTYRYYAVSNTQQRMYGIDINMDMNTGNINSATIVSTVNLTPGSDLEGIAYNRNNNSVYVSDEAGPAIREYSLTNGSLLSTLNVPSVYTNNLRANRGFEALGRQYNGESLWTSNEEALAVDGGLSTINNGSTVRLQKYNSSLGYAGQYAYLTDSIENGFPQYSSELSGISDMVVLPDGTLLVLERECDAVMFTPHCRNRIYAVDYSTATDVSLFDRLDGGGYTTASKSQLWQNYFDYINYEGLCLGPKLNTGAYSMLMISDDATGANGFEQKLYSMTINGVADPVPEPSALLVLAAGAAPVLLRRLKSA